MQNRPFEMSPDIAQDLLANLADFMAQLRVDEERELQMAHRAGPGEYGRTEARAYAKAIFHVRERLEPLVFSVIPDDQRGVLENWISGEASRRLADAARADEFRA